MAAEGLRNMQCIESVRSRGRCGIVIWLLIASIGLFGCSNSEEDSGEPGTPGTRVGNTTGSPSQPPSQDNTAPSTPTGLNASVITPTQINLAWTASADNVGVTGYRVYRNGALLITLGTVTTYQNSGLTASTTYSYTVQAMDGAGNASGQSTAAIVTTPATADTTAPSAPTGLTANVVSGSRIDLAWSAATDNIAVTGYRVFQNGALLVSLGNVTTYQNTGLAPSTTYIYTVRALDAAGNVSGLSTAASATTPGVLTDTIAPSIPTNLVPNAVSPSQINLSWSASTDNVGVAGYRVYRNGVLVAVLSSGIVYQDTGLTPSTTYSYNVDAIDAVGNASGLSPAVNGMTLAAPDTIAPSTPTGLAANAVSSSQINLSWTASSDNLAVTGYRVFRDGTLLTTLGNVTTYQNIGLTPSTTYSYRVRAIDLAGNVSNQSNAASAMTQPAPDTTAPTTPTGLIANAISSSRISLSWSASTDNVAVSGYRVYQNGVFLAAVGNVTTYQTAGLAASTTYSYNVDAIDSSGNASGVSAVATATTLAPNTATLGWDPVTAPNLVGYRIYYGTASGIYFQAVGQGVNVGNVTTHTVTGLGSGTRYFFAATAVYGGNVESVYSIEVFKDIP